MFKRIWSKAPTSVATRLSTKYTTTTVLQLPCTCGLQSAQQVAKETFYSKRGPPRLEIMETSLQKPSRIALVNDFRTEGHLAACHLVAYGRTATTCQHLIWLQSQNHPVHTISASVPKFSATPTTLHNLTHSPWYFPAVTLIRLLCIRDLCRPAKQSISTSLEAILHP